MNYKMPMRFLLLALVVFNLSCEKRENKDKKEFEIISQTDVKFDLVFPEELWDQIMRSAPLTLNTKKTAYELFESLFMQVELVDGPKEVLSGKNYRFDLKDFGGEIDFNTYLNREAVGHFRMFFNFPSLEKDSEMRVFFLSWTKQYTKDEEVFGNGCGHFYELTSYFKKEVFKNGLLLHTNNYRYLDFTGGRLYFVSYTKNKIQLAQVTLTDSSLEKRMCSDRI